jgi:hypothetical protein
MHQWRPTLRTPALLATTVWMVQSLQRSTVVRKEPTTQRLSYRTRISANRVTLAPTVERWEEAQSKVTLYLSSPQ